MDVLKVPFIDNFMDQLFKAKLSSESVRESFFWDATRSKGTNLGSEIFLVAYDLCMPTFSFCIRLFIKSQYHNKLLQHDILSYVYCELIHQMCGLCLCALDEWYSQSDNISLMHVNYIMTTF